jgi:hypothetical protein
VEAITAMMMMIPPMVGVPSLHRWFWGPSFWMYCPHLTRASQRITAGPKTMVMTRAVSSA